jgi:hypothetical protein
MATKPATDVDVEGPGSGWPEFPAAWRETYATLHLWLQIVGKTRLALAPMENHWWQIPLYLTTRGLSTSPMPYGARTVAVEFDFCAHQLRLETSTGRQEVLPLTSMTVADFFARYQASLRSLQLEVPIFASPVEVEIAIPFAQDHEHKVYDPDAAHRCFRIFASADRVLKRFRGGFTGKQSPAHVFWGSFDLAATRFSGRPAPRHPGGVPHCPDRVMVEAYSHECASCGFWPGDGATQAPSFYAYSYPEPTGYAARPVAPADAHYDLTAREFLLPYESVRTAADPEGALLSFWQSTYEAAADLGRWDRAALDRR